MHNGLRIDCRNDSCLLHKHLERQQPDQSESMETKRVVNVVGYCRGPSSDKRLVTG